MSAPRRVPLTARSSPAVTPVLEPAPPADHSASHTGTVRLVFTLFEPDQRNFPEFNYPELLESQRRSSVPLGRFKEEELKEQQAVSDIVKELEKKYGERPRKHVDRIQDLIDMGYGYDEDDSFIDNSEAYDEFVPSSITTKHGGFYVNSGLLQFREVSAAEHPEEYPEEHPEARRRRESSKKRKLSGAHGVQRKKCSDQAQAQGTSSPSPEPGKGNPQKKKKAFSTLSVTNELKKVEMEQERQRQDQASSSTRDPPPGISALALGPADAAGGGCMSFTNPLLGQKGSTEGSSVDSDSDCELVIIVNSSSSMSLSPATTDELSTKSSVPKDELSTWSSVPMAPIDELPHTSNVPLAPGDGPLQTRPLTRALTEGSVAQACPEGFPPGLEESISRLLRAAKTSKGESKAKHYTPDMNKILLEIDAQCKQHGGPLRSMVFSHLCSFLPCSKKTLLQRVNKLKKLSYSGTEEEDMERLMKTLRLAIEKTMPEQILHWKALCKTQQRRVTAAEEEREEAGGKRNKGPKKWFRWSEEIRESLRQLLQLKMERFQRERQGLDVEGYLSLVLDDEVKPLWPKGWMRSSVLLKEAKKLLFRGSLWVNTSETQSGGAVCDLTVMPPDSRTAPPSHPPAPPPDLLVAAVARYKRSVQRWGFSETTGSPPLPPPPPQSSPINFPLGPPTQPEHGPAVNANM